MEEKNLKYKSSNSNLVLSGPLSTVCYWSSPFHRTDETVYRIAYVLNFAQFHDIHSMFRRMEHSKVISDNFSKVLLKKVDTIDIYQLKDQKISEK